MPAYNGNADRTTCIVQNKTDAKDIISNKISTLDLGQIFEHLTEKEENIQRGTKDRVSIVNFIIQTVRDIVRYQWSTYKCNIFYHVAEICRHW